MWTGSRGNVHGHLNYMLIGRIYIQILPVLLPVTTTVKQTGTEKQAIIIYTEHKLESMYRSMNSKFSINQRQVHFLQFSLPENMLDVCV